ncbi:hypothetical protein BJY01DRAFT_105605 [Aspergillus pseudoustus]|uniref:Uncharacterized protein n=1 Tax=Aspergillus pseudoustus TaxID=1810923 RepID=A0ABR4IYI9_9EURO
MILNTSRCNAMATYLSHALMRVPDYYQRQESRKGQYFGQVRIRIRPFGGPAALCQREYGSMRP